MEDDKTQPPPPPALAGEKHKREEGSPDAPTEEGPAAVAGGEDTASSGGGRHPMWKTSLCSYFRRRGAGADGCSHGESCRYAHSEEELRQRPEGTWDPTSDRAKKLRKVTAEAEEEAEEEVTVDEQSLDKCLVGLPRGWMADRLKTFLQDQGISYATAKKKKGMTVGFVTFESIEQLKNAVQVLKENPSCGKEIKIVDANRRSHQKVHVRRPVSDNGMAIENGSSPATPAGETSAPEAAGSSKKSARDAVTPLAHMPYNDQLEHKKHSMAQILKRLTRNARKACPPAIPLPNWIFKSKEIGGLPCKLEGILESPVVNGYRNKCEFSVGYSLEGKKTVGFMLGNFREGVTAVEEPVNCPNVSGISCKYALMFQDFLQSSSLPLWSRIDNCGFWRQFTVREGRSPAQAVVSQNAESQISEVMLIVQVCSTGVDEVLMKEEFDKLSAALLQGAAICSPPFPLTAIVVQDHKGISNAASADCPLIPLLVVPKGDKLEDGAEDKTRIHDHISNLKFSISPTAFFQVNTLAAERLYTLAGDWANLNSDTLLFDVCCGTGTIGLTLAHRVGMVVGIEMNESAVSDAHRNALINGIKNCRFVCGKAEDVMGSLLTEYLGSPQQHIAASESNSEINDASKNEDIVDSSENNGENMDSSTQKSDNGESQQPRGMSVDHPTCAIDEEIKGNSVDRVNMEADCIHDEYNEATGEQKCGEASLINDESIDATSADNLEHGKTCQDGSSIPNNDVLAATACQFKNVVAIVDPPRVGLHPTVIKALRTHPRIRHLVYISCNPDSLVANAIELCTPTSEKQEKNKGNRGWRSMSSAGLARQRTKSMPNSEPFVPKRAMAVDLFPHTSHCEMVMLFER
ncbi:zinc finger CCCH domain-containing protein 24 [Phragmites australis]|uniref:zinc finger CCCH domain-containing protein 24 n=1 Tax=Phragmites australis TaxID=29695 RepID=UPI002D788407|nr:zinc finger CCCH domain-containing protein 24 [Phragmites australis]